MARQAHAEIEEAINSTDPNYTDQIGHLKSAVDILKHFPPGHYGNRRSNAERLIKSALFELGIGDPDHKAIDYMRDADSAVRDIESR